MHAALMVIVIRCTILALWLALCAYWLANVRRAKSNAASPRRYGLPLRVAVLLLIVVLLRTRGALSWLRLTQAYLTRHEAVPLLGLLLCAAGLGLALAARVQLGRNWGMPMSRKAEPELVTRGPYAYARHPIYGGLMLGMLGSALGENVFWMLPLLLFGSYFIASARREERLLLTLFADRYAIYQRDTKMMIPFVI